MRIDIKDYKNKVLNQKPNINLVPFIDILFTIMIFLVVTSSFNTAVDMEATADDGGSGKPNVTDTSGDNEFYIVPVANLHKVTVNGEDMSSMIKNNAIGVQARVMDQGEVSIKPGEIVITTPSGISPQDAVHTPEKN